MFNGVIFKQTMKANWKLWAIFTALSMIMLVAITAVFDMETIYSMTDALEGTLMAAMMKEQSFLGVVGSMFFKMQGIMLLMIYVIITANSLVASQVDRGSMAYLLSTPTKRSTIIRTQALYLITAIFATFLILGTVGTVAINVFQGDAGVSIAEFLSLTSGAFLLMFAIAGISFFFSAVFNLSKHSMTFGAGLPLAFFILDIMADMNGFENLRYGTLFTLFDISEILASGNNVWWQLSLLAIIGCTLFIAGGKIFVKKDLPL